MHEKKSFKIRLKIRFQGKFKKLQNLSNHFVQSNSSNSSNLTSEQKKGLTYLKKHKDEIAIVPFDKGQGFVSISREKLIEKSEKEFSNVSLDTKDTTHTLQNKIQKKN